MMKKRIILSYLFGIVVMIYFLFTSNIQLKTFFQVQRPEFLLISGAVIVGSFLAQAYRLNYFLKTFGIQVKFSNVLKVSLLDKFFIQFFPSRINIPAKSIILYKLFHSTKQQAISITTFEFAIDTWFTIFFALIGVYIFFNGTLPQNSVDTFFGLVILVIVLLITFFLFPIRKLEAFFTACSLKYGKIFLLFSKAFEGFAIIREQWIALIFNKSFYPVIVISILSWIFFGIVAVELIYLAFGYYVPVTYILVIIAMSGLIGGLSQTPGGLGTREAAFVFLTVLAGYSAELALVNAIIFRILFYIITILGYFYSVSLLHDPVLDEVKPII